MRNPMIGRVTSHYDLKRRHPVFGTVQPHRGMDLGAPVGIPPWKYVGADVRAAYGGVVERVMRPDEWTDRGSNWGAIWGRSGPGVFIRNPDGEGQYFGHLSRVDVKQGQRVTEGQVIGGMGSEGRVTGPHLHFEIHASTSGPRNNYTHTRDPMADFRAAGITPGVDNAITITPAATTTTPKEDDMTPAQEAKLDRALYLLDSIPKNVWGHEFAHPRTGNATPARAFLASGYANGQAVHAMVAAVAEKSGIDPVEVERIIRDAIEKGLAAGVELEAKINVKEK